jgi:hypothetical protein
MVSNTYSQKDKMSTRLMGKAGHSHVKKKVALKIVF